MEVWKDIEGYEGLYQISNEGRVKSLPRKWICGDRNSTRKHDGIIMKQSKDEKGYKMVCLSKDGKAITKKVHKLVGNAFLENPNNLPQINHKDENKENNLVFINEDGSVDYDKSNLEWCTLEYNVRYGTRTERTSKKVYQYTIEGELVKIWDSTAECGRNGFSQTKVSDCCNGGYFSHSRGKWRNVNMHKGYKWSYELLDFK